MARSLDEGTENAADCSETDDSAGKSSDDCNNVVGFEVNADMGYEKTTLSLIRTIRQRLPVKLATMLAMPFLAALTTVVSSMTLVSLQTKQIMLSLPKPETRQI